MTATSSDPQDVTQEATIAGDDQEETLLDRYGLMGSAILTGVALALGWGLGTAGLIGDRIEVALYIIAYLAGGTYATIEAVRALWHRRIEIDLLMVTAAIGAAIIGHWAEGAILLFLFSLGNALEHYALGRTTRAVRALMELSPDEATVLRDGEEHVVKVSELSPGDLVVVKPGERIPADGEVESGHSVVDQSAITGESIPVTKRAGDQVFSGTINGRGALRVTVTRLASESTLARIIRIVQEAQADKSDTQRFTDRFEGAYAGGVIAAAGLYFAVLAGIAGIDGNDAFYRSIILLVVASPCALVISTPASILSALANAARNGVLVKGAAHLENIGVARVVAFDKTGTLTVGEPRVVDVVAVPGVQNRQLLEIAAAAERSSEHPLGEAVVRAARERGIDVGEAESLQAITGRGIEARVDGRTVLIGTDRLLNERNILLDDSLHQIGEQLRADGNTTMYVAAGDGNKFDVLGVIAVADALRQNAREVVQQLHEIGVERTVILTGDNERSANAIARQVGITDVHAGLLPEDKLKVIEELKAEYGSIVMVGDGVNDAPALAQADLGIAIGAGTDVAIETADVVLMRSDPLDVAIALKIGKGTLRKMRQNLGWAIGYNAIALPIAAGVFYPAFGIMLTPEIAAISMSGSSVIVAVNALLLKRLRLPAPADPATASTPTTASASGGAS